VFSRAYFKDYFYFDKGLIYPKNKISQVEPSEPNFSLINTHQEGYTIAASHLYISKKDIRLPKGAQGFKVYNAHYKIIWRYMNTENFFFSDKNIMINHNWILISSNNKSEILYILSILNSNVTKFILWKLLSNENEKSFQIGIKIIKEFCRIPKITEFNKNLKQEIIDLTQKLLDCENSILLELVEFQHVLQQKFDTVEVQGKNLVIGYKNNYVNCKIKENPVLIQLALSKHRSSLFGSYKNGKISELKNLVIIDQELQTKIKKYIDDLIFALYFKVKLSEIGFNNLNKVRKDLEKHKYYKLISEQSYA